MSSSGGFWQAGDSEEISVELTLRDAGSVSFFDDNDGYGKFWIWMDRGSGREYLQGSLITVNPTKHEFDFVFDGTSIWDDDIDFVVPAIFAGETVYVKKVLYWSDDDSVAKTWNESHYVNVADLDDIENEVISPDERHVPNYGTQVG